MNKTVIQVGLNSVILPRVAPNVQLWSWRERWVPPAPPAWPLCGQPPSWLRAGVGPGFPPRPSLALSQTLSGQHLGVPLPPAWSGQSLDMCILQKLEGRSKTV